jgi:hypothetical protein
MARRKPVLEGINPDQVYKDMAEIQALLGRLDQYEACGQDCSTFRMLAHELYATLQRIDEHVIKGRPVPAVQQPASVQA